MAWCVQNFRTKTQYKFIQNVAVFAPFVTLSVDRERSCAMSHYSHEGDARFRKPRPRIMSHGPFRVDELVRYRTHYARGREQVIFKVSEILGGQAGWSLRFKGVTGTFDASFFEKV